jgi:hypothetical protein
MTDMHREAFERDFAYYSMQLDGKGNYACWDTFNAWLGWKAAIRHLTEQNEQRDSHE